jgi:hypothetical protein
LSDRPKLFSTTGIFTCLEPACGRAAFLVGTERFALVGREVGGRALTGADGAGCNFGTASVGKLIAGRTICGKGSDRETAGDRIALTIGARYIVPNATRLTTTNATRTCVERMPTGLNRAGVVIPAEAVIPSPEVVL